MFNRLLKEESGQTMIEYGLLIAFISIATLIVLVALGPRISGFFDQVDQTLEDNPPVVPVVPAP